MSLGRVKVSARVGRRVDGEGEDYDSAMRKGSSAFILVD